MQPEENVTAPKTYTTLFDKSISLGIPNKTTTLRSTSNTITEKITTTLEPTTNAHTTKDQGPDFHQAPTEKLEPYFRDAGKAREASEINEWTNKEDFGDKWIGMNLVSFLCSFC